MDKKEKKLINSDEIFKLIFDNANDAYFIYDKQGKIKDLNKATELLTDLKKKILSEKHSLIWIFFIKTQLLN